jgi:hypothetical protein
MRKLDSLKVGQSVFVKRKVPHILVEKYPT